MTRLYRTAAGEREVRDWCRARLAAGSPSAVRTVSTSLGETHVAEWGRGDDLCLYLPGTNSNAATSVSVLRALAEHVRVVCPDLPGQPGLSTARRPDDEVAAYAEWVNDLMAEERRGQSGRLVLAGHSRGAAVALSANPDSVHGLVLAAPAGIRAVRVTASVLRATLPWLLRPTADRASRLVELMAGSGQFDHREDLVAWYELVARSTRTTGAPGPLPGPVVGRWSGRAVVALVGDRDVFFPPTRLREPVARHLGVPLDVVAGTGHLLVDERPDRVVDAVRRVLAR